MKRYALFSKKDGSCIDEGPYSSREMAEKEKKSYSTPNPDELEVKELEDIRDEDTKKDEEVTKNYTNLGLNNEVDEMVDLFLQLVMVETKKVSREDIIAFKPDATKIAELKELRSEYKAADESGKEKVGDKVAKLVRSSKKTFSEELVDSTEVTEEIPTTENETASTSSSELSTERKDNVKDNLSSLMKVYLSLVINPDTYPMAQQVRDLILSLKSTAQLSKDDLMDISKEFDWSSETNIKHGTEEEPAPNSGLSHKNMSNTEFKSNLFSLSSNHGWMIMGYDEMGNGMNLTGFRSYEEAEAAIKQNLYPQIRKPKVVEAGTAEEGKITADQSKLFTFVSKVYSSDECPTCHCNPCECK